MDEFVYIDADFINSNIVFEDLIADLKYAFRSNQIVVPKRHHHDIKHDNESSSSTMLLMPAWQPKASAGVKMVTINPNNATFNLPSVQGIYILTDSKNGTIKAILEAKSLTAVRTAAASALASTFLSRSTSASMLMIGNGALAKYLIQAHACVRPIETVYVWGRDYKKSEAVCKGLNATSLHLEPISHINNKITEADIISCATLSKSPLVFGEVLSNGQHIDLVGSFKKDMREADDATMAKASIFIDTKDGLNESGDIAIPMANGIINKDDIKATLFDLCQGQNKGRISKNEITVFKSVGHALEDLVAANYFYELYQNV